MCPFRINKRCFSIFRFRRRCGIVRMAVFCSSRKKYERSMAEKRACIEAEQCETEMMLGMGA